MLSFCTFYLITFTVQDIILLSYSELSFKWPNWPKNDVKKIFYLLTVPSGMYLQFLGECNLYYMF